MLPSWRAKHMAFKYTDVVFKITNGGTFCDFCGTLFNTAKEFKEHRGTHPFGHVEKAVLLALADHANKAINNLCEIGIITRDTSQRSSTYRLNIETDPAVIDANRKKAMNDAGIEPPDKTVRMGGKTYSRKPQEEIQFLDGDKATTTFNIEDELA
jgi:hypothetical protein